MKLTNFPTQESDVSLRAEFTAKVRASDVALILAVPVTLTLIYLLPVSMQQSLYLDYNEPSVFNLWSSAYVHHGFTHFRSNLIGYLLTIIPTYLLLVTAEERRLFRYSFISFLVVLPPVLALVNIIAFGDRSGAGFSGIGSAFIGLLPVALMSFIQNRISDEINRSDGIVLFLVAAGMITMRYMGVVEGFTIILISGCLTIFHIRRVGIDKMKRGFSLLVSMDGYFELILFAALLFLISPMLLFPQQLLQNGQIVNVISHYVGLVIGFFAPTVSAMYLK